MNHLRVARQRTNEKPTSGRNLRRTLLLLGAIFVVWAGQANAQQSLGDVVAEAGLDWMIGRWVAKTDDGDKLQLTYRRQLEKHLVTIVLRTPDFQYYGMIFYVPAKEQVVQVGVDDEGGSGKGLWQPEDGKAILKIEHTGTEGETQRMGFVHSKVNAETMKVGMYALESTGELADEPWAKLEFKRHSAKARKKDK
jgi:hypothetical protein